MNQLCRRHPTQQTDSYCLECFVKICRECVREHSANGHRCVAGEKAKGEVRSLLHDYRDKFMDVQEDVNNRISNMKKNQKQKDRVNSDAVQAICDTIDSVIDSLQKTKLELVTALQHQAIGPRIEEIQEYIEDLVRIHTETSSNIKRLKTVLAQEEFNKMSRLASQLKNELPTIK